MCMRGKEVLGRRQIKGLMWGSEQSQGARKGLLFMLPKAPIPGDTLPSGHKSTRTDSPPGSAAGLGLSVN